MIDTMPPTSSPHLPDSAASSSSSNIDEYLPDDLMGIEGFPIDTPASSSSSSATITELSCASMLDLSSLKKHEDRALFMRMFCETEMVIKSYLTLQKSISFTATLLYLEQLQLKYENVPDIVFSAKLCLIYLTVQTDQQVALLFKNLPESNLPNPLTVYENYILQSQEPAFTPLKSYIGLINACIPFREFYKGLKPLYDDNTQPDTLNVVHQANNRTLIQEVIKNLSNPDAIFTSQSLYKQYYLKMGITVEQAVIFAKEMYEHHVGEVYPEKKAEEHDTKKQSSDSPAAVPEASLSLKRKLEKEEKMSPAKFSHDSNLPKTELSSVETPNTAQRKLRSGRILEL